MRVIICGSSEQDSNDIAQILGDGLETEIFSSAADIAENWGVYDLAVLDTENGRGFDAARRIYALNSSCVIVFYTDSIEFIKHGYEFHAFRYILKSEERSDIERQLTDALTECRRRCTYISGTYKGSFFNVFVRDIMYIDIFGHTATIHTTRGDHTLYTRMNVLEEAVKGCGFIRCHRSYLVNAHFIHSINGGEEIVLADPMRTIVPVGVRYRESTLDRYENHFRGIF